MSDNLFIFSIVRVSADSDDSSYVFDEEDDFD